MVSHGFKGSFGDDFLCVITSAFLMLAGCIVIFSISLFIIVFYIEDIVTFKCGVGEANKNFQENLKFFCEFVVGKRLES